MVSHTLTKAITSPRRLASTDGISQPDQVWDCQEAAQFLRIHPKTVVRLARGGQLPSFRIGNRWRFRASDLDSWAHGAVISPHSLRRE
jgi:excisionase family DNA binding protein